MITLHLLEYSRAQRIVWLLEMLETEYRLQFYPRNEKTMLAPDALKAVHPLGKSPVLEDGGTVLAESGAIVDYLIQTYGNGNLMPPRQSENYWPYQRWLHYAEGSLMPLMLMSLVFRRIDDTPMPFFAKPVAKKITGKVRSQFLAPQLALHLGHIENGLAGKNWLFGDEPGGADVMMSFPLQAAAQRTDLTPYPHIRRYLAQIEAHPAYRRAVAKAGTPLLKTA
uniref:glutathione transferase n=1 Tax=Neisseria leonii TaxID=2995413 RepID=A0A9X4IDE9_9NEIS|nr:glutathione S-transferase [Neisseria sp. 51.81]MDD9327132.1 glutathione S-transferase [Neisseria sp. 51.81]